MGVQFSCSELWVCSPDWLGSALLGARRLPSLAAGDDPALDAGFWVPLCPIPVGRLRLNTPRPPSLCLCRDAVAQSCPAARLSLRGGWGQFMVGSPNIHNHDGGAAEQNQALRAETLAPPYPLWAGSWGTDWAFLLCRKPDALLLPSDACGCCDTQA